MRPDSEAFLRQIVELPGPSGYEQPVQAAFRDYVRAAADRLETDVMGSVHAVLNPEGRPRLMFAGHADQIGFVVNYADDEGFLYLLAIGGIDVPLLPSKRVRIWSKNGPVLGVFGRKSVHLQTADERGKSGNELHQMFVDIGARTGAEALERVSLGDPVTFADPYEHLSADLVAAPGLDNRAGCFIAAETIRLLHGQPLQASIHAVSTVQEEIGLRGARTSAYRSGAEVGIALDVGHVSDYPGVDKRQVGPNKLGEGPMITRGPNINPRLFDLLVSTAKEEGIPYQVEVDPAGTGTDANTMQLNQGGMATALLSVPLRYMHSTAEVASLRDIENTARLCAAFARRLSQDTDFTP